MYCFVMYVCQKEYSKMFFITNSCCTTYLDVDMSIKTIFMFYLSFFSDHFLLFIIDKPYLHMNNETDTQSVYCDSNRFCPGDKAKILIMI